MTFALSLLTLFMPAGPLCSQDMVAPVINPQPVGSGIQGAAGTLRNANPTLSVNSSMLTSQYNLGIQPVIPGVQNIQVQLQTDPGVRSIQAQEGVRPTGLSLPTGLSRGLESRAALTPSGQKAQDRVPAASPLSVPGDSGFEGTPALPRPQRPEETSGVKSLDGAMKDIEKAKKEEAKGADGAVASKLDLLFDFSRSKNAGALSDIAGAPSGMEELSSAAGLPDPKQVGIETALGKMRILAEGAQAADAPYLYQSAVSMAKGGLSAQAAETSVSRILAAASRKAVEAVGILGQGALDAATGGRTSDALRYTKAVHAWNELLSVPKNPLIVNLPEFKSAVKHVLAQALKSPGKTLPSSKVVFEGTKASGLRALVALPAGIESQVAAVPLKLPESLALEQAVVAWEPAGSVDALASGMSSAFGLTPQAGLRDFYRAQRAAGSSVLKGFWLAARSFIAASVSSLGRRLRSWLLSALRWLGLIRAAAEGMTVDSSPGTLDGLRSLDAQKVEMPAPESGPFELDGFGLGYNLHRVL
ncbi:MAG: hypothetical protein WC728_12515 [Elusimicrobiota bacterium]